MRLKYPKIDGWLKGPGAKTRSVIGGSGGPVKRQKIRLREDILSWVYGVPAKNARMGQVAGTQSLKVVPVAEIWPG